MNPRLSFIKGRVPLVLRRLGPSAVTLKWTAYPGTPMTDPVTHSKLGASTTETLAVNALVHFVHSTVIERRFAEIQAGDVIADFDASLDLDSKEHLRFVIDNVEYVQKEIGEGLAHLIDAFVGGQKFFKPVYLRRAT